MGENISWLVFSRTLTFRLSVFPEVFGTPQARGQRKRKRKKGDSLNCDLDLGCMPRLMMCTLQNTNPSFSCVGGLLVGGAGGAGVVVAHVAGMGEEDQSLVPK